MHLPVGITLQGGKYEIVRYISSGGFGCTYEARHTMLNTTVAIKEFFVKDYCNRDASTYSISVATQGKVELIERLRKKFIEEAQAIFNMNHPNIVRVTDIFEENGTVYYVMDYIEGCSLASLISDKGRLGEKEALGYIHQVADALGYVHSCNRLHLDVKPQNIMIDKNGKAVLIDFGVSKQYDEVNGENTSTLLGSTPGYAPIEQSGNGVVRFYPSADIYALGATLYKALTGVTPVAAHLRASGEELEPLPTVITEPTRVALDAAMQINKAHRPQSVEEFLELLKGSKDLRDPKAFKDLKGLNEETVMPGRSLNAKAIEAESEETRALEKEPEKVAVTNNEPPSPKKNRTVWVVAVLGVLIVCGLFFALSGSDSDNGSSNGGNERIAAHRQAYQDSIDAVNAAREAAEQQAREEAARRERESSSSSVRTFTVNGVEFKMVAVEGGTFQMGSNDGDSNEKPVHSVTLSDYYIGETEVTQALWQAVMGSNPSYFTGDLQRPVEQVSYEDCETFINKLNSLLANQLPNGLKFRFPTEAEWEYAARGGNRSNQTQYSGSSNIDNVAWYHSNSGGATHPVKQKQPNELGIYDMSGNVYEWCNDWYSNDYYSNSPRNNPQGPSSSPDSYRVLRGGNWYFSARYCRVAYRNRNSPDYGSYRIGLRLALVAGGSGEVQARREREQQQGISTQKKVDLGLSVCWAGWNVGTFSPEGYGNYYAWGETTTKSDYTMGSYQYYNVSYVNIGSNICGTQYDVARAQWGGSWRLPTKAECQELKDRCTWTWTTYNGVKGHKVTGPNGNSIFLPPAGFRRGSELYGRGSEGYYWSGPIDEVYQSNAYILYFFDSGDRYVNSFAREYGLPVRPVCDK